MNGPEPEDYIETFWHYYNQKECKERIQELFVRLKLPNETNKNKNKRKINDICIHND